MTELLSFEKSSNPFLRFIETAKNPKIVAVIAEAVKENAALALPLSSTIENGKFDEYFLGSHFLKFHSALKFTSLASLSGALSPTRDKLTVENAHEIVPVDEPSSHLELTAATEWLVLRESTLEIGGDHIEKGMPNTVIPLLLLSSPLPVSRSLSPSIVIMSPRTSGRVAARKRMEILSNLFGSPTKSDLSALSLEDAAASAGLSSQAAGVSKKKKSDLAIHKTTEQQMPGSPTPSKSDAEHLEEARAAVSHAMAQSQFTPFLTRCLAFVRTFTERFEAGKMPLDKRKTFVCNFVAVSHSSLCALPPFNTGSSFMSDALLDHIEDLIAEKLFPFLFRPSFPPEKDRNAALTKRINTLSWLEPRHLDLAVSLPDSFVDQLSSGSVCLNLLLTSDNIAKTCLGRLNHCVTPRLKLACILSLSKLIYSLFEAKAAGADDLLPLLIYLVIRANPPLLHSNMLFISSFRSPSKLSLSESGYYFTQLQSAVAFIETMDQSSLTVTAEEWDMRMNHADKPQTAAVLIDFWSDKPPSPTIPSSAAVDASPPALPPPTSSLLSLDTDGKDGTAMAAGTSPIAHQLAPLFASSDDNAATSSLEHRFPFVNREAESLSPADVGRLLAQYKEMAHILYNKR